jgi:hypothetical protein
MGKRHRLDDAATVIWVVWYGIHVAGQEVLTAGLR